MDTKKMHPATEAMLTNFEFSHLPPDLQEVSAPIGALAKLMAEQLEGPELTAGLRKLLEAKDCFVRAKVQKLKAEKEETE